MGVLLPQVNDKVVEFEKYTTAVEIRNKIGRNYFLKMVMPSWCNAVVCSAISLRTWLWVIVGHEALVQQDWLWLTDL